MSSTVTNPQERRQHPRFDVQADVIARVAGRELACRALDMSEGGICLAHEVAASLRHGEEVQLEVRGPGLETPARISGRVRWSNRASNAGDGQRRSGIEFLAGMRVRAAKVLAALVVSAVPLTANAADAVPSFDPNADMSLDGYEGGERPDELEVQSAFEATFGEIDLCVEKARKDKPLPGDAHVHVLLDPHGDKPIGVNAELDGNLKKNKRLNDCLRAAAAHAHYPKYDGPPVVVDFDFELDPGWVEE